MTTIPLATANPPPQYETGQIILGTPTNFTGPGIEAAPDGFIDVWVRLTQTPAGNNDDVWFWFNGTGLNVDMDVKFYKDGSSGGYTQVTGGCRTENMPEQCIVPLQAKYANLLAVAGADITFNFTVIWRN